MTMRERLEVRLDPRRRHALERLASERGVAASEVVRQLIDEAETNASAQRRRAAFDRLLAMDVVAAPDLDELKRDLESMHDQPDLPGL